jgi:hypothetical protein
VSIVNLFALRGINLPVLNLTTLSSDKNIVLINLVHFSWLIAQFECLQLVHSACL